MVRLLIYFALWVVFFYKNGEVKYNVFLSGEIIISVIDEDLKRIYDLAQRYGSVFVAESYIELILSVHVTETADIYSIVSNSQNHHIQKHSGVNTQIIAGTS